MASQAVDYDAPPQAPGAISAGSTWRFQAWYRAGNSGPSEPLISSDAGEITFCD